MTTRQASLRGCTRRRLEGQAEVVIRHDEERRLGSYYMVWDAIAAKADRHSGGWRLLDFLRSPAGVRGDGGREQVQH